MAHWAPTFQLPMNSQPNRDELDATATADTQAGTGHNVSAQDPEGATDSDPDRGAVQTRPEPTDKDTASIVQARDAAAHQQPVSGAVGLQTRGGMTVTGATRPVEHKPDKIDERDDVPHKAVRKRPKPGERRLQILQTLAEMLETPRGDRITTAALAGKLNVSEAALYRHFASKAQMFEGLIDFIESTLFGLINQITTNEEDAVKQLQQILEMLLAFAEHNPGMTRLIIGDALVNEDDRLQARINKLIDRLELSIKQCFRSAVVQGRLPEETDAGARSNLMLSYVQGKWLRFAKGGFKRSPTEGLERQALLLIM